jgi:hypothetical protein
MLSDAGNEDAAHHPGNNQVLSLLLHTRYLPESATDIPWIVLALSLLTSFHHQALFHSGGSAQLPDSKYNMKY